MREIGSLILKFLQKIKYKLKYFILPVPNPEKWVFIVGCSNSGTTLLHNLLAKHPSIGSLPAEGQFCTNQLPLGRDHGLKRLWAVPKNKLYLDERGHPGINVRKLKKQWAARFNGLTKPVLLEKSPPNTVRLKWLQANFSNAYFIGIVRNGYAVAEGIRRKAGHPVEAGAEQWMNANEIMLEDFPSLANKILIPYEELTENTEEIVDRICKFIGISTLPKEHYSIQFKIHGKEQRIRNLNNVSFQNLSKEDIIRIEHKAGILLKKLNYSRPVPKA